MPDGLGLAQLQLKSVSDDGGDVELPGARGHERRNRRGRHQPQEAQDEVGIAARDEKKAIKALNI